MMVTSIFFFSHHVFTLPYTNFNFSVTFNFLQMLSNWAGLKYLLFGKELNNLMKKNFVNIVAKEGNVCIQYFLFSHTLSVVSSISCAIFNSLPNNNVLDWTKFKALLRTNVATIIISVFDRVENNVGKGENAGYQHFLLFPQCFQKYSFSGSLTLFQMTNFRFFKN